MADNFMTLAEEFNICFGGRVWSGIIVKQTNEAVYSRFPDGTECWIKSVQMFLRSNLIQDISDLLGHLKQIK